jgi:hypothetical protein
MGESVSRHNGGVRARIKAAAITLAVITTSGAAAVAVAGPAAAVPVGCGDDFYLASASTITQRAPDGTATPVSTPALDPWTIALDPTDGYLYGFPNVQATGNHVFRIEADGTSTDLGAVTGLPANTLYSLGGFNDSGVLWTASPSTLYAIDVDTMSATSVALSAGVLADFAAIDGTLYSQGGTVFAPLLARVDPATGVVATVALPGMINATSFFTVAGHLYISQGTTIAEVLGYDTATPTLLTVATGLPSVPRDGASCPTGPSPFLNAVDDDFTATPFTVPAGGSAGIVLGNDSRLGVAVVASDVTTELLDDSGLAGATVAGDGTLTVPAGGSVGTYSLTYRMCAVATPTLCDTAVATVRLVAPADPSPAAPAATLPPTGVDLGGVLGGALALLALGGALLGRRALRA